MVCFILMLTQASLIDYFVLRGCLLLLCLSDFLGCLWSFGGYLFRGSGLLCCNRGCSLRRSNWSCFFCCGTFLHDLGRLLCLCGRFAGCRLTCTTTENGVPIRCVLLVSSNSCNRHKITFHKCSPCGLDMRASTYINVTDTFRFGQYNFKAFELQKSIGTLPCPVLAPIFGPSTRR